RKLPAVAVAARQPSELVDDDVRLCHAERARAGIAGRDERHVGARSGVTDVEIGELAVRADVRAASDLEPSGALGLDNREGQHSCVVAAGRHELLRERGELPGRARLTGLTNADLACV